MNMMVVFHTSQGTDASAPIRIPATKLRGAVNTSSESVSAYVDQGGIGSVPITLPLLPHVANESIDDWFRYWADRWTAETGHLSSLSSRRTHEAYKNIVGLQWDAVPRLLAELHNGSDFWFSALREITRADPVTDEIRGDFDQMCVAWLGWADSQGIKPRNARYSVPQRASL